MTGQPLVDWQRAAYLDDGWHAVIAVGADGTWWPWLLDPSDGGAAEIADQAHEQLGPLPLHYRRLVERCGALTQAGTPCSRRAGPVGRCTQHAHMRREP